MVDEFLRDTRIEGPFIPGTVLRLRLRPDGDSVRMLRQGVQERGRGLFVFQVPFMEDIETVAEAYYPDEIKATYAKNIVDPARRQDFRDGRLIIVHFPGYIDTVPVGEGPGSFRVAPHGVTPNMVREIREFNRAARSVFRNDASASMRAAELEEARVAREEKIIKETGYYDAYTDAALETLRLSKPRVYQSGSRA